MRVERPFEKQSRSINFSFLWLLHTLVDTHSIDKEQDNLSQDQDILTKALC